jgi:hypothetical protein
MSAPERVQGPCRVTGAEKLPAEAGGAAAICAAVQRAIAAQAPRTALAANLETVGRRLPELRFSVSDRELNPQAIGHFADSVAEALAGARQR